MKAPAFQLYPQDFISSLDVQLMSAAEVGAYCLLLFNSWTQPRQGFLPNDEAQLRHLSRLSPEEWKTSKKKLLAKFPVTDDKKHRYNPRLLVEAEKQASFREKQTEHGKRGGRPRQDEKPDKAKGFSDESQNNPTLSQPLGKPNPAGAHSSSSSSTSSSSSSNEEPLSLRSEDAATAAASAPEKKTAPETHHSKNPADQKKPPVARPPQARPHAYNPADIHPGLVLPFASDTFLELWAGYRQYREEQKMPRYNGGMMEQEALRTLSNLAGDEATAAAIISQTIRNGWKNLFKLDEPRPQHPAQNGAPGYGQRPAATVHANPFGIASPQSIAIARAVVMGGTDPNFGLDL